MFSDQRSSIGLITVRSSRPFKSADSNETLDKDLDLPLLSAISKHINTEGKSS